MLIDGFQCKIVQERKLRMFAISLEMPYYGFKDGGTKIYIGQANISRQIFNSCSMPIFLWEWENSHRIPVHIIIDVALCEPVHSYLKYTIVVALCDK